MSEVADGKERKTKAGRGEMRDRVNREKWGQTTAERN